MASPFGQYCRAIVWLITARAAPRAISSRFQRRPCATGMRRSGKYSGLTKFDASDRLLERAAAENLERCCRLRSTAASRWSRSLPTRPAASRRLPPGAARNTPNAPSTSGRCRRGRGSAATSCSAGRIRGPRSPAAGIPFPPRRPPSASGASARPGPRPSRDGSAGPARCRSRVECWPAPRGRDRDARAAAPARRRTRSRSRRPGAVLNNRTGTFISMTDSAANELVGTQATISASPFHAINTPSAAPTTAIASASVSSCCTMRTRAGAEGRAHGELLLPMRAAHEQQDRHVGAADEQQRRHGAEQQKEPRPHRPRVHLDDAAQVHSKRVRVARRASASRTPAGSAAARRWLRAVETPGRILRLTP